MRFVSNHFLLYNDTKRCVKIYLLFSFSKVMLVIRWKPTME